MNITKSSIHNKLVFELLSKIWPSFEDGEFILPGDRVFIKSINKCEEVYAVYIYADAFSQVVVKQDESVKIYSLNDIEKPEPDTFESIIKELNPNIDQITLDKYISRLKKIDRNANIEDVD